MGKPGAIEAGMRCQVPGREEPSVARAPRGKGEPVAGRDQITEACPAPHGKMGVRLERVGTTVGLEGLIFAREPSGRGEMVREARLGAGAWRLCFYSCRLGWVLWGAGVKGRGEMASSFVA